MKLSTVLIAAVSAAVLASCNKKCDDPKPVKPEQQSNETPGNNPNNLPNPDYCPACGLG
jgi:hypothetical protein